MMKKLVMILISGALLLAGCRKNTVSPEAAATAAPTLPTAVLEDSIKEEPTTEYKNIRITVRQNAQTVSDRSVTSAEEMKMVEEIVFDSLVKSAVWEGLEVSELERFIALSFDWTSDQTRQTLYQYDLDGRHVLQWGEAGSYTVMSDGAYQTLLQLADASIATGAISLEEAAKVLEGQFGTKDAATGNTFSFQYVEQLTIEETAYYRFRISWLVDNDHLSYLTDYLVSTDGKECKEYIPEEQFMAKGEYQLISAEEAKQIMEKETGYIILDVRTEEEFKNGHIPGAVLIPDDALAARAEAELPDKTQKIFVYCRSGRRSAAAAKALIELGYQSVIDFGGILSWPYATVTD